MRIDIHTHPPVPSLFSTNALGEKSSWKTKRLKKIYWNIFGKVESDLHTEALRANCDAFGKLSKWVRESSLDKIVLLALDNEYDDAGESKLRNRQFFVENDFIAEVVKKYDEYLYGTSIHPYRKDAISVLEDAVLQGAVVVKWIPSAQNIDPADKRCCEFYEALASFNLPLLVHTGVEHSLAGSKIIYNNPSRLIGALERGVAVIAAHCGMNLFLHEKSYFESWCEMAFKYEHFYGDTAALAFITRVWKIRQIVKSEVLCSKMVYGSDFPTMPAPHWCPQLGGLKIKELKSIENPIERNLKTIYELGFPSEIVDRSGEVLCRK